MTQHRRLAVRCPCCGLRVAAPVPAEVRGTPFGPRLHAVALYLKTFAEQLEREIGTAITDPAWCVAALRRYGPGGTDLAGALRPEAR